MNNPNDGNKRKNKEVKTPPTKNDPKESWFSTLSPVAKVCGGILTILTLCLTVMQIYDRCNPAPEKTAREKFDDDYITSKLNPPVLISPQPSFTIMETSPTFVNKSDTNHPLIKGIKLRQDTVYDPTVLFYIGSKMIFVSIDLLRRKEVRFEVPFTGDCQKSSISFGVLKDRLYVSAEFKSLQNEETIGIIEYNWWRLFKKNMFDFKSSDDLLQVKDKQSNLVFFIQFLDSKKHKNIVSVGGYFISSQSVNILSLTKDHEFTANGARGATFTNIDTCINKSLPDWKQRALFYIENNQIIN